MKGLLTRTILTGWMFCMAGVPAFAQVRIATVDFRKLFDNYWKTKQADVAIKEQAADAEKEHKDLIDGYTKAKADYQTLLADANNQAISNEERDKRKKAAEDKLKEIKETEDAITQFERSARTRLDERRQRMRNNIVEEIHKLVSSKAKSAGYSLLLDSSALSATDTPVVLYSNNEEDITDSVLQQLNAGAPPDLPKTTEPADSSEKKK